MKKILLFFAVMCCMMVAKAQQFTDANGIKYNVTSTENKTVEVIANNYSGAVVIPATVTNEDVTYNVTSIGDNAFQWCDGLTSVALPGTVTEIGDAAFEWCTGLTSMTVLASTPPTLGEEAFNGVTTTIPVYVPEVDAYINKSWGGFTNFQAINIDDYKQAAKDEIEAAMVGMTLTGEEEAGIDACIAAIENVTTLSDENLTIIENKKNAALAIISQAAIRLVREAALAAIEAAMQGETSDYITGLAQQYIGIINSATDATTINNTKETAVTVLNAAVAAYKAGKGDAFGSLGEKQRGPAIEVIKDGERIILYRPDRVHFIRANN